MTWRTGEDRGPIANQIPSGGGGADQNQWGWRNRKRKKVIYSFILQVHVNVCQIMFCLFLWHKYYLNHFWFSRFHSPISQSSDCEKLKSPFYFRGWYLLEYTWRCFHTTFKLLENVLRYKAAALLVKATTHFLYDDSKNKASYFFTICVLDTLKPRIEHCRTDCYNPLYFLHLSPQSRWVLCQMPELSSVVFTFCSVT